MAEKVTLRADRMLRLRDRNGWTQMEAAYRCKCNQGNYNLIERGLRTNVTLETLVGLARGFETSIEFLLGLSNDPAPRPASALDKLSDDQANLVLTYEELNPVAREALRDLARRMLDIQHSQERNSRVVRRRPEPESP